MICEIAEAIGIVIKWVMESENLRNRETRKIFNQLQRALLTLESAEKQRVSVMGRGCLAVAPMDKDLIDYASEVFGICD